MIYCDSPKPDNPEKLLSRVAPGDATIKCVRSKVAYEDHSDRFRLRTKCFMRQFAHLYATRLIILRPEMLKSAHNKWGNDIKVRKLCDLTAGEKCAIIGTVFKDMQLRPSILREISDEHNIVPQPIGGQYSDDSDKLILEDELQRIVLIGSVDVHAIITGVVFSVFGHQLEDDPGKFMVEDVCYKQLPHQLTYSPPDKDRYVALVSGFDIGCKNEKMFRLQMLVDLLTGQLGDTDQQADTANIVAVIIAGNSLSRDTQDKDAVSKAKYLTKNTAPSSMGAVTSLDHFLVQLASNLNVYVMPGEYDPANHTMPQQPLHPCMFPLASRYSTLKSVTNPHDCTINGVRFTGTSGQPIDDIARYSRLDDRLAILENTLRWGHMAPTAPDSLGCYPYYDTDPFIITDCPRVFFAGNQSTYATKEFKGCDGQRIHLVTIPKFSLTGQCVLVNLRTLDCLPLMVDSDYN